LSYLFIYLSVLQAIWGPKCSYITLIYDDISAARSAITGAAQKGPTFQHQHVPGHQDSPPIALDISGTLSVWCDAAAVRLRVSHTPAQLSSVSLRLAGECPVLVVDGQRLVKNVMDVLRRRLSTHRMRSYFVSRRVPQTGFEAVVVDSLAHAMQQQALPRRIWITKCSTASVPLGAMCIAEDTGITATAHAVVPMRISCMF